MVTINYIIKEKEPEIFITPEMILELLGECASLSDEKNDLEKTLKAEKTSTEKAKKIQEALKAHNDLIKTKLQQLENFVKKVSFQELEKKYIDSFSLKACHNKREKSHRTLKKISRKGKTSVGFFYGSKLHTIFSIDGKLNNFLITPGNVSDCNEKVIDQLCSDKHCVIYGDKGYLLRLTKREQLTKKGIRFVTKTRSNMKPAILSPEDKYFLKKLSKLFILMGIATKVVTACILLLLLLI